MNKRMLFEIAGAPTKYLIWSVEHNAWWKQSKYGYSNDLSEAGLFSKEEASDIVEEANVRSHEEVMIPQTALRTPASRD